MPKFQGTPDGTGTPTVDIVQEDAAPALRIRHEGVSGNAIEIVGPNGAVLGGIDKSGNSLGGSQPATDAVAGALPNFLGAVRAYNDYTASTIRLIGLGSSVGLGPNGGLDATNSTIAYLNTALAAWINRLNNMTITATNGSVAGTTIATGLSTDYAAAKTAAGGTPNLVLLTYGMNEGTPGQYYAGITLGGIYNTGQQLIEAITKDGADVIILTTPHLNTATYDFTYGGAITYPAANQHIPAANASVVNIANCDGITVPANYLHLRVNQQLRQLAADTGCVLLDAERYWLQAVAAYGVTALFDSGQTVHPNLFGFQQSYFKAIDDFVAALKKPSVRAGILPGQRTSALRSQIGLSNINTASGGTFTINLPAGVSGELVITASSGGGNQSVWKGVVVTTASKAAVSALTGGAATVNAQVVSSVAGSVSAPQLTVTAAATGSGCQFAWNFTYQAT